MSRAAMAVIAAFAVAAAPAGIAAGQQAPQRPNTTDAQKASPGISSTEKGDNTQSFITNAYQSDLAEVQLGQLAMQNAESKDVKSFAQRMITDHTKNEDPLKKLAAAKQVTLPQSVSGQQHALDQRLSGLVGAAFDREYMNAMVTDHEQAVASFQAASKSDDADVRAFAQKTLPVLQEHLQLAKQTQHGVVGTSGSK